MAFSIQRAVSDGTMTLLPISIEYFDREEISVMFDGVLNARQWAWVGTTDKTLSFTPAVADTVEVMVVRSTDLAELRHQFSLGAQFTAESLDESLLQILHIAQEAKEGSNLGEIFQNLDFHGFKAINMGNGSDPGDAVNHAQMEVHDATIVAYRDEAEAAASAAATSAAALPNATGNANTVPVVNPTGTGWMYKSPTQMVSYMNLGNASGYNVGTGIGNVAYVDSSGITATPGGFYGTAAGSDSHALGPYLRLDAAMIQAGAGNCLDFWTYSGGWGRRFRIGAAGQLGIGPSPTYGTAGQVLTSGGPSAAPSWGSSSGSYTSAVTPLPSAGAVVSVAHGLGSLPADAVLEMKCLTAEGGFSIGDVVQSPFMSNGTAGWPLGIWKSATHVGFTLAPGYGLYVLNKTTGTSFAPTAANWSYRFRVKA